MLPVRAEADREALLGKLIARRAALAKAGKIPEFQACDVQIMSHPIPKNADAGVLARRLAGKWRSPRHDYHYRADGSWVMLPLEEDSPRGRWRVVDNRLEITSERAGTFSTKKYTLILATEQDLVFTDGTNVFSRPACDLERRRQRAELPAPPTASGLLVPHGF